MRLSIIVALARNGVIGRNGQLPWRLSSDLRRFKQLTLGHPIVMGRKTYESIGRPLPGRESLVITRQPDYAPPGVACFPTLAQSLRHVADRDEVFVIGGGEVYSLALPHADRLYVTWVEADVEGDTRFPAWNPTDWQLVSESRLEADDHNSFATRFQILDRVRGDFSLPAKSESETMNSTESQLLDLTSQLLQSIGNKDWKRYLQLCDPSLTCFEPECLGQLVSGLEFHKFYFDLEGAPAKRTTTLASPHVRLLGSDAAVVSYIRLIQKLDGSGSPVTVAVEETRVWQKIQGEWKHVHFHRSAPTH